MSLSHPRSLRRGTRVPTLGPATRELLLGLVRYGLVGLANAATYYGAYLIAHPRAGYLVAHVVGLGVAMVVSFLLNCRFTFRVRPTWTRLLLYPASQTVNILATTVGVVGLVHLGVDERLAPLVAAILAMPVSFLAARFLIARAVSSPVAAAAVGPDPETAQAQAAQVQATQIRAQAETGEPSQASPLDAVTVRLPRLDVGRR